MAPSFYDAESSSPSLFISGVVRPSSASKNNLPSLAVLLGLIGVLVSLILVAGVCIYAFRCRLFPPAETPPVDVPDKTRAQSQVKDKETTSDPTRSSYLNLVPSGKPVPAPREESDAVPVLTLPTLRPFLLDPARPVKSTYGEVCFAQQESCKSLADHHPNSVAAEKYQCFEHLINMAIPSNSSAKNIRLTVSQSCPACLEEVGRLTSEEDAHPRVRTESGGPALDSALSTSLSLLSTSSGSSYSTYSQESDCASDSSSYPWDYYINTLHENLFYKPEPPTLATCAVLSGLGADDTRLSSVRVAVGILHSPRKRTSGKTSSGLGRRDIFLLKARFLAVSQARKVRRMRSRCSRFASARLRLYSPQLRPSGPITVEEPSFREDSLSEDELLSDVQSQGPSTPETPDALQVCKLKPSAMDSYLLHTPRSSSRRPLGNVTNTLTAGQIQHASTKINSDSETGLTSRPSLLLNGLPADSILTPSPPRFTRLKSPPRNPELLNTRWAPRPATPPLTITVFAKDRQNAGNKYPGRRVALTPPAGISLVELRSSIERILDRDVRMLRGMVLIRSHQMFLPIVTESFYNQWVKERVRDGGVGVVEAWLR